MINKQFYVSPSLSKCVSHSYSAQCLTSPTFYRLGCVWHGIWVIFYCDSLTPYLLWACYTQQYAANMELNKLSWLIVWSLAFLLNCIFDSRVVFVYGFDILSWWIYAKAYPTTTWIFEWGSLRIHCLCICGNLKRQYIKKNTSTVNSFRLMRALCDCWIIWHDNNLTLGAVRMRQKDVAKVCFLKLFEVTLTDCPRQTNGIFHTL